MHQQTLHIDWLDADQNRHSALLIPQDLVTRDRCEYLRVTNQQHRNFDIRLDSITQFEVVNK